MNHIAAPSQGPAIAITDRGEVGTFAVVNVARAMTSHRAVLEASRAVALAGWSPIDTVSAVPQQGGDWRVELKVRGPKAGRAHV